MRQILFTVVVTGFFTTACASATRSSFASNPDLIASDEIRPLEDVDPDAYDLVQRVRPQWLRSRGNSFVGAFYARVFLNGALYGELGSLHQISSHDIREIRYHDARDATTLYGTGYSGGVIHVRTRP